MKVKENLLKRIFKGMLKDKEGNQTDVVMD
jgi:hypothetical protein